MVQKLLKFLNFLGHLPIESNHLMKITPLWSRAYDNIPFTLRSDILSFKLRPFDSRIMTNALIIKE